MLLASHLKSSLGCTTLLGMSRARVPTSELLRVPISDFRFQVLFFEVSITTPLPT